MYAHGKLDLRFSIISLGNAEIESWNICGVEDTRLNWNLYKSKAEKSGNHEFWRKMFCLVAITYTSPKVSVTANKRVPRKKKRRGSEGFQIWYMYQINLTLPRIRLVSNIRVYVCIYIYLFWYLKFFFVFSMCKNLLRGWLLEIMTRYMRYWDDLSLTQLLVGHIGHPKKDRLAE